MSYTHNRKIYGVIDLLGDLGGVTEVIMIVFGVFLFPVSEFSFVMKAAKRLFLARTRENEFFMNPDPSKKANKYLA